MSELMSKIKEIASIKRLEAEQVQLREQIQELQREHDSLEVIRQALIVARDGNPPKRTWSRKKKQPELEPLGPDKKTDEEGNDIPDPEPAIPFRDDPSLKCVERCIRLLEGATKKGLTAGEISHILKVPYHTVYDAVKKDGRFTVALGKWTLKRKG